MQVCSRSGITCSKLTIETLELRCEICSKLTIKTPKRRHWCCFGVFIVNFEHISQLCSSVSIVNFEQVNTGWVGPSLAASLEPLAHRQNVASLSLFYRYYFGRC